MYGNISEIPTSCLAICFQVDRALRCLSCWMADWDGTGTCFTDPVGIGTVVLLGLEVRCVNGNAKWMVPGRQWPDFRTWHTCLIDVTGVISICLITKKPTEGQDDFSTTLWQLRCTSRWLCLVYGACCLLTNGGRTVPAEESMYFRLHT